MTPLSAAVEYFAEVSQKAISAQAPYRGRVEMLHYGDYILITSEICGEIERRWFHKQYPIFYYYLPKDIRIPIVHDMYRSGCSISEIAELIGLSRSTISNDISEIKQKLDVAELPQIKAQDVTREDLILKSTINQKPRQYNRENAWLLD
jgi:predicted transcriptional regulator